MIYCNQILSKKFWLCSFLSSKSSEGYPLSKYRWFFTPNSINLSKTHLLVFKRHTHNLFLFRNFEEGSGGEMQIDETEGEKAGTM